MARRRQRMWSGMKRVFDIGDRERLIERFHGARRAVRARL